MSLPAPSFPGPFPGRPFPATDLLVRGIRIDGNYVIADECTVFPVQETEMRWYIQGGPRSAIADIGGKWIEGQIRIPLLVDGSYALHPALLALIRHAERPVTGLRLDTNHALSHLLVTAENGGTDDNELLSFDCLVVSSLKIQASPSGGVSVTARFEGLIDVRDPLDLTLPPDSLPLCRALTWQDCDASRYESRMSTLTGWEISIDNTLDRQKFLLPYTTTTEARSDQYAAIGVKRSQWTGTVEEIVRLGLDRETYLHGGFMVGENVRLGFGPMYALFEVPLFKPGEQPLTKRLLKRRTNFFSVVTPAVPDDLTVQDGLETGGLFYYHEAGN